MDEPTWVDITVKVYGIEESEAWAYVSSRVHEVGLEDEHIKLEGVHFGDAA